MEVLASISLDPGSWLAWLVVGLVAGFFAGKVMRGSGYGLIGDIVVGIIGAIVGGFLLNLLDAGATASFGLLGSIIVAFIGACILITLLRLVSGGRSRRSRR
jgi:uncharacterized membrane protein YeaQ/YmgE (transglycosylase-associated protein family)